MKTPRQGETITLFKACFKGYSSNPLPSRSPSGRYHDEHTKDQTTYLTDEWETAWAEVTHRWGADPGEFCKVQVRVTLHKVLDLTDPAEQARYAIKSETLVGDGYRETQLIANRLRQEGFEAIWTISRADQPSGKQLAVFLDQLDEKSEVIVESITSLT